jgi:hypothetical protein
MGAWEYDEELRCMYEGEGCMVRSGGGCWAEIDGMLITELDGLVVGVCGAMGVCGLLCWLYMEGYETALLLWSGGSVGCWPWVPLL